MGEPHFWIRTGPGPPVPHSRPHGSPMSRNYRLQTIIENESKGARDVPVDPAPGHSGPETGLPVIVCPRGARVHVNHRVA